MTADVIQFPTQAARCDHCDWSMGADDAPEPSALLGVHLIVAHRLMDAVPPLLERIDVGHTHVEIVRSTTHYSPLEKP